MKGWLFTKTNVPLELIEKPDPVAGSGQVVVAVKAAGLCLTDLHQLEEEYYMQIAYGAPCIIGHECAGVVESVGEGVTNVKVGDRVAVEHTVNAATHECIGFTQDGGYATKILVQDYQCIPMPDNVSFAEGASATCAGQTAYHAVFTQGSAKPGAKVGFIGIGGLGQYAVGIAAAAGCEVYAASRSDKARDIALSFGAKKVAECILDFAEDGLDIIVDFAGTNKTLNDAIKVVKYGGTVVLVGMSEVDHVIQNSSSVDSLILKEIKLVGNNSGVPEDITGLFDIMKNGKFKPQIVTIPFEKMDEGLQMLKRGEVNGKLVAVME